MAISFVGKGTFGSGTASVSAAAVTGVVAGDLLLLFVESANEPIAAPSGWTQAPGSPVAVGTAAAVGAVALQVFYQVATGADVSTTVGDSGNHTTAIKLAYRGVSTTNPFDVTPTTSTKATASTSATYPSITTVTAGAWIVLATALDLDLASTTTSATYTNAALTGITERHDQTVASGAGGGLVLVDGVKATAGATGTTSAVLSSSSAQVYMTLALRDANVRLLTGSASASASTSLGSVVDHTVGLTHIGSVTGTTGAILPPYSVDDLAVAMAFAEGTTTPPSIPAGWTQLGSRVGTASAAVLASKSLSSAAQGLTQDWVGYDLRWGASTGTSGDSRVSMFSVGDEMAFARTSGSTTLLLHSPDGVSWTHFNAPYNGLAARCILPTRFAGLVWACGGNIYSASSFPGTWTVRESAATYTAMATNGTTLVAGSTTGTIKTTTDGTTWTSRTSGTTNAIQALLWGGGVYLLVTSTEMKTSPDGITWGAVTPPPGTPVGVPAYGGGMWAIAGPSSFYYCTTLGVWSTYTPQNGWTPEGCTYHAATGRMYLFGNWTWVAWTDDLGATWTEQKLFPAAGTNNGYRIYALGFGDSYAAASLWGSTHNFIQGQYDSHTGFFTGATAVAASVYRGVSPTAALGTVTSATGTGTTVTLPAMTPSQPGSSPRALAFSGHASTDVTYPDSATARRRTSAANATSAIAAYDSGGAV